MFYPTTRRPPKSPPAATEWSRLLLRDVVCSIRTLPGGDGSAQRVFVPGDLDL